MLRQIEAEVRCSRDRLGKGALDPRVVAALRAVPRHEFVPDDLRRQAYDDGPLGIGYGQTISQPYLVAVMTDLLRLPPQARVLEIGTGSGYQAAVLALLARQVYSVELVAALARAAAERLARLGYANVEVRSGDGYYGWPEHAPYDGIVVTAAAPRVPAPLLEQLRPGARLVIPVGRPYAHQELVVIEKHADGSTRRLPIMGVSFVPLVVEHAARH